MKNPLTFLLACCLSANSAFATLTGEVVYCDVVNGNDGTGAVGDSSKPYSDIYSAITAAINAENSASAPIPVITVIVRPGTYSITNNPLYITQQVNIRGEPGAILIDNAASGAALLAFSQNSAGSTVEGLTFNGGFTGSSSPTANQGLVDVDSTNHISVRNCVFCTGKDSGVRILDSQDCLVEHCQISAVSTGIEVQGNSDRVQLSNNSIQNGNNPTAGIGIDFHPDNSGSATQATVTDNQIGSGFQMGIQVYGVEDRMLIGHNAITGTGWGISFDHPNDSLIDGNTIYATTVIGIELADGCQHVTASNNIVHAQSGPAYNITTPNLGSNYVSSVAINIIGGEASTNDSFVLQAYAQNDVHVSEEFGLLEVAEPHRFVSRAPVKTALWALPLM